MKIIESYAKYILTETVYSSSNIIKEENNIKEIKIVTKTKTFIAGYEFLKDEKGNICEFKRINKEGIKEICYLIYNKGEGIYIYKLNKIKENKRIKKSEYELIYKDINYKLTKKSINHNNNLIKLKNGELIYEEELKERKEINKNILKIEYKSKNWIIYEKQIEEFYNLILNKKLRYNFFITTKEMTKYPIFICFIINNNEMFIIIKLLNDFNISFILMIEYLIEYNFKELKRIINIEIPSSTSLILEFLKDSKEYNLKSNNLLINYSINKKILKDIINCLLLEKKLILISSNRNRLYNFLNYLLKIIKPLNYTFFILNVSNKNINDFIEIPFPFILLITELKIKINEFIYFLDSNNYFKPKNFENNLPNFKNINSLNNLSNIIINKINLKEERIFLKKMTSSETLILKNNDKFINEFLKTRCFLQFFNNSFKFNLKIFPLKFQFQENILIPYFLFIFKFIYSINLEKIILLKLPSITLKYFQNIKNSSSYLSDILPFIVNNLNEIESRKIFNFLIKEKIFFPPESLRIIGFNKNKKDFSFNNNLKEYKIYLKEVKNTFKDKEIFIEKIFIKSKIKNKVLHEFKIIDLNYFLFLSSDDIVFNYFITECNIFKWNFILFLCFFSKFNKIEIDNLPEFDFK